MKKSELILAAFLCLMPACGYFGGNVNILEEVPPTEDLMREHGVLNRVLIIYDTLLERLKAHQSIDPQIVLTSAETVRDFVHNYHEKQEEMHIFSIFEKHNSMMDMVTTLKGQHVIGAAITENIIDRAKAKKFNDSKNLRRLAKDLESFISMYRAHESREDTELFPLVRTLVTAEQFEKLADEFEESEEKLFGKHGFERMVKKVGEIERLLGIHELSHYTPELPPVQ